MNYTQKFEKADATIMTSFLKNEVGDGSMKNGLIKLLSNSTDQTKLLAKIKNKNILITIFSFFTAGVLFKVGFDFLSEEQQKYIVSKENDDVIREIENMSETEIQKIVDRRIEEETILDRYHILVLRNIESLVEAFLSEFVPTKYAEDIEPMKKGIDWVMDIIKNSMYKNDKLAEQETLFNNRCLEFLDKLLKRKDAISTLKVD